MLEPVGPDLLVGPEILGVKIVFLCVVECSFGFFSKNVVSRSQINLLIKIIFIRIFCVWLKNI